MFGGIKKVTEGRAPGEKVENAELARLAGMRAENLFTAHRLSCSEANLLVLNHGFGGRLATDTVIDLASGFGGGVGETGCTCGALSGVVMGLGLYLGPECKGGLRKKQFRALIGEFYHDFKESAGSVLCRELIVDFRKDRKKRASFCSTLTGKCAETAVKLLLENRPELAEMADLEFLRGHDTSLQAMVGKILSGWMD